MQLIHMWFLIVGGVLSFAAVGLSFLWQWLDGAADSTITRVHQEVSALLAEGHRPAAISEAEERALEFKRWAAWVRPVGVFCLYGGIALLALGCLLWGIHALDQGVPVCRG